MKLPDAGPGAKPIMCDACADHHGERCDSPWTCRDHIALWHVSESYERRIKELSDALQIIANNPCEFCVKSGMAAEALRGEAGQGSKS